LPQPLVLICLLLTPPFSTSQLFTAAARRSESRRL
jgi:hypothetical protein